MAFPSTYNFNYYRGDFYQFVIRPKTTNGQQFNLSSFTTANGGSALFKIASARGKINPYTQYTGTVTVDSTEGTVTCTLSPTEGRKLSPGSWVYDIEISNSGGTIVYTLLTGTITVTEEISGANLQT